MHRFAGSPANASASGISCRGADAWLPMALAFAAFVVALIGGCGTEPVAGDDTKADVVDAVAVDVGTLDTGSPDTGKSDSGADVASDVSLDCPGGAGCPCVVPNDCDNALCIDTPAGNRCAFTCLTDCPDNTLFVCAQVAGPGGDVIQMCVPRYGFLCDPCTITKDCSMLATTGQQPGCFRSFGDGGGLGANDEFIGAFCSIGCSDDASCPIGYACKPRTSVDGEALSACTPIDEAGASTTCNCSPRASIKALSTTCTAKSETGICPGTRACKADGNLAPCSAAAAVAEVCDGVDNDCDGSTDEGLCDDGDVCTDDACDSATGVCAHAKNSAPCDDDNGCTGTDTCGETGCKGSLLDCDDSNPCTDDSCAPATGCVHKAHNKPCDDSSACTNNDLCDGKGACVGLALDVSAVCSDDNPCTSDGCDKKDGCTHKNALGACEDSNPCTNGDTCKAGLCSPGENVCACQADVDCSASEDGNLCNGTLFCDKGSAPFVCKIDPKTVISCDQSKDGTCASTICDSTTGKCGSKAAPDAKPCDADGSVCTSGDACSAGVCEKGALLACDDGKACTDDSCDAIAGCKAVFNIGSCDDGDPCSKGDSCASGQCIPGKKLNCDDGNECTFDYCDKVSGNCVHDGNPFSSDPCDADKSVCTKGDSCANGVCTAGKALLCNDQELCTTDSCDAQSGCKYLDNANPCDADGNPCTGPDACKNGTCVKGLDKICDDKNGCTVDACDKKTGSCTHDGAGQAGAPCDADGTVCTDKDACSGGKCVAGKPLVCDDSAPCTDDSCHVKAGCVHENLANVACDDGDKCTKNDLCLNGLCKGLKLDCDDKNPCTEDACAANAGCKHTAVTDATICESSKHCVAGACVVPGCGDGYKSATEACDDGNIAVCDGCESCVRRGALVLDGKGSASVLTSTPGPDGKSSALGLTGDLTIELWLRPDAIGTAQIVLAKADAQSVNMPYALGLTAQGQPYFQHGNAAGSESVVAAIGGKPVLLKSKAFVHLAVTVAGGEVRMFVGGAVAGVATLQKARIDATAGALTVGMRVKGETTTAFIGRIDELHIAAAALHGGAFVPARETLVDRASVGLWRFDDAPGTKAQDAGLLSLALTLDAATLGADDCLGADPTAAVCGDGKVAAGLEACDDGAAKLCDGCEACRIEKNLNLGTSGVAVTEGFPKWAADTICTSCRTTIEAWVRPDKTDGVYEIAGSSCGFLSLFLAQGPGGGTYFGVVRFPLPPLFGTTIVKPGKWYHVAGSFGWGAGEPMRIWVNGALENSATTSSGSVVPGYEIDKEVLFLGSGTGGSGGGCVYKNETPSANTPFPGAIDEIRVSKGLRYEDTFTPRRRLLPDADTRGLWHFDGPAGLTADDSGHDVKTVNANAAGVADTCYGDTSAAAQCGDGQQARWEPCDNGIANGTWPKKCSPGCTKTSEPDCTSVGWQAGSIGEGKNVMTYDDGGWAVEGWVRLGDAPNSGYGVIVGVDEPGVGGCGSMPSKQAWRVAVGPGGVDASSVGGQVQKASVATPVWKKGAWQHFALQSLGGGLGTLWVDGQLARSFTGVNKAWSSSCALRVGGAYDAGTHNLGAELASLRLSKGPRYGEAFTPRDTLDPDSRAVWLFDFAESSGTVATDLVTGYKITLDSPKWSAVSGPACTK